MKNIRKIYIKNLITKLIKTINNKPINKQNLNKNIITKYNNKWDYNNIIYNYNNNNILKNISIKNYINKYIKIMLNHKIKILNKESIYINILYKKPIIILKNNNIDIILFIYIPEYKNKNRSKLLINNVINNLINNKLNKIINTNNIINKIIKIKPIILTYNYLDSEIYSKSLSKFILKNPKFDNINNITINNNLINQKLINKLNNTLILNKINIIKSLINKSIKNNSNIIENSTNKILTNKFIINNNLLYQLIIGCDWKFKGKNSNLESNARALKYYNTFGKLSPLNNKIYSQFKLNNHLANLNKSQSFIINKNGKFNISVTLNHF